MDLTLTREQIDSLTYDQARDVIRAARDLLEVMLNHDRTTHEHWSDDCGDYMEAATQNWTRLWNVYFDNDGTEAEVIKGVREFLTESPDEWLACDGDVRFDILPEIYNEWEAS
jgi:hypothetical protein